MATNNPPEMVPSATRLRSSQTRLDSLVDAAYLMDTAVATNQARTAAHVAAVQEATPALGDFMNLLDEKTEEGGDPEESRVGVKMSRAHLKGAVEQVEKLQADIAGMEAVVEAVRGYYNKRTVTGRRLPKLVSKAAMRNRTQELVKLRHEQLINPSAAASRLRHSETKLAPLNFDLFFEPGQSHKLPLSETKESCSRADAKLLLQHLEGVMPDGAISSKYRRAVHNSGDAIQLYHDVLRIKQDYKMVDATLRECGRQNAAECLDRTHVTEKVRKSYAEMFNAVLYVLCVMYEALHQTKVKHDEMASNWDDMEQQLRVAKAKAAMEKRLREENLTSVEAEREELRNMTAVLKEEMAVVQRENESLAAALEREVESFDIKMKAKDEATAFAQQGLQAELESARDDCDDLQRQLRLAEKQLARLRRPKEVDMGKSVKATQTEHTPAYQPIHAAVSVASEIRTAATSGRKQNDSEDDESEGHDVELEREARAMGTDPTKRNKQNKKIPPATRWQDAVKTKSADVSFADSAVSRTRSGVRDREGRSRSPLRIVAAAGEFLTLHSKTKLARAGNKPGRTLQSSASIAQSGKKQKRVKSAPGGDAVGFHGEDALESDFDEYFDFSDPEPDLIDVESPGQSSEEASEVSEEEEEEPQEDIEKILAAMEAEENWDEEDSDLEDDDAHVPNAENMSKEELQAAREQRRQDRDERKAARKLAKKQALREAKIQAHEEKMQARAKEKAAAKEIRHRQKLAAREQRKASKQAERDRRAQLRQEREELVKLRRAEHEERKLRQARNASAPPAVSAKAAKRDAVRLGQMKPSAGISRKTFKSKRKTAKLTDVGGFSGMMKAKMKGRVKGAAWMMKQVATIYADYLVQEKYMSRDGEPGQFDNFNHFVYKWHMSQFGLKQIAEMNLIDLIATVRANAAKHHQLQVFGRVVHILPGSDTEGSLDHVDYYLFCMRSLAGKKPMQTLFTADGTASIPTNQFVSGLKMICNDYLRDEPLRESLLKQLDIKDLMRGTVTVSEAMPLLMATFQRKFVLAQLHQEALLKAVDLDRDGYIDWEGFSMAAFLAQQSSWGRDKDENDALHAFHAACKMSKRHNCCMISHGVMKLRAHLGRLWSLEHSLPTAETNLNEDGVPVLPANYAKSMQEQLEALMQSMQSFVQSNPASTAIGKLLALIDFVAETIALCGQGREDMEVGFCSLHVLQAQCTSLRAQSEWGQWATTRQSVVHN